jgi:hypothetical protein
VRMIRAFHDGHPGVEPGGVDSPTWCQGHGTGPVPATSIFDLPLSAIVLSLRPTLTGHEPAANPSTAGSAQAGNSPFANVRYRRVTAPASPSRRPGGSSPRAPRPATNSRSRAATSPAQSPTIRQRSTSRATVNRMPPGRLSRARTWSRRPKADALRSRLPAAEQPHPAEESDD